MPCHSLTKRNARCPHILPQLSGPLQIEGDDAQHVILDPRDRIQSWSGTSFVTHHTTHWRVLRSKLRDLLVPDDALVLVVRNGEFVEAQARNIRRGEVLVRALSHPLPEDIETCLRLSAEEIASERRCARPTNPTIPLTEEFGWWLGVHIGNGSSRPFGINISDPSRRLRMLWRRVLRTVIASGASSERFPGGGRPPEILCYSAGLSRLIARLTGCGSPNRHAPNFLLRAPGAFILGLLAGILDTDGSIPRKRSAPVTIATTTSRRLAVDLVKAISLTGMHCNVLQRRRRKADNMCGRKSGKKTYIVYEVTIRPWEFVLGPSLNLRRPKKARRAAALRAATQTVTARTIPKSSDGFDHQVVTSIRRVCMDLPHLYPAIPGEWVRSVDGYFTSRGN